MIRAHIKPTEEILEWHSGCGRFTKHHHEIIMRTLDFSLLFDDYAFCYVYDKNGNLVFVYEVEKHNKEVVYRIKRNTDNKSIELRHYIDEP